MRVFSALVSFVLCIICLGLIFVSFVYANEELPWGVERISAPCVWDKNQDGAVDPNANCGQNKAVAIIDTGVIYLDADNGTRIFHEDLADNIAGGMTFEYRWQTQEVVIIENEFVDDYPSGHGTEMAGIVAAVDNELGVIGGAPKTKLWVLKMYSGIPQEAAAAINWCAENGIQLISISWELEDNAALRDACSNAYYYSNCLIFASSGNYNTRAISNPANYTGVIAVGATNETDGRWIQDASHGSDYGPGLDLVAPGVNIRTTDNNWGYSNWGYSNTTGTSPAVPHVAATAALVWAAYPDLENWQVEQRLIHSNKTLDLGSSGWDEETGYGLVNAYWPSQRPEGNVNSDSVVDIFDVAVISAAFGSEPGDLNWNAVADIRIDRVIDIFDIVQPALHFGEEA